MRTRREMGITMASTKGERMSGTRRGFVENPDGSYVTPRRGLDVMDNPLLNKGTAFSREAGAELGLDGLIPSVVETLEEQVRRAYAQYRAQPPDLLKNVYLTALQDRNEV